uniref:Integrase, catalytic region, zinc finger, CCHC-type, peptidase aspartic, catalytic n=1 Tax=Tanacetum cinerariifolium TaxID=118510 RepID=A0A699IE08_TANCI|nr:hypothetical protein [Tanacetum cinerariifolium]
MTTLAEHMIVVGAENHPSMLDKAMYNSWQSRMRLYIKGKKNGRMMLDSLDNGLLVYLTIEVDGVTRPKKYSKLNDEEKLQDDCDIQASNIILQGLPSDVYSLVNHFEVAKDIWDRFKLLMKGTELSYQEHECKLYNEFDKFTSIQEWSKFVTDVKLAKSLYTTNYDQLYAYLSQHERHENEARIMRERGNTAGQARVVKCYKYKGEGHIARQCTHPKRPKNLAWFKEKLLLVEAHESDQVLDEERLAFLVDPRVADNQATQTIITRNAAILYDDLNAYDSDCDDFSYAKAALMANDIC